MAAATRIALFDRRIEVRLGTAALELLFDGADLLSEGERRDECYFGSTMITLDLARASEQLAEVCDAVTAQDVAAILLRDARARERAEQLALADAEVRAGAPVAKVALEVRVRAAGTRVLIDVDLEGKLVRTAVAQ